MEPAACSLHRQPLESNLYIHFKAHKTTIIRRHPVAPMTQTHKFSPSNQVFGLSLCKLLCRVWKSSCSVSLLMSWSCWHSSSWSWSICPLRLEEKGPFKCYWISSHECWLEFHFRGVTHSLKKSGSQVSCCWVTRASCRSRSHITADSMAESLAGISWSVCVCWIISWAVLVRRASRAWAVSMDSARAVAPAAAEAAMMIAETIQARKVPKKLRILTWERARLRVSRPPGSSHSQVTLTGSQISVCLWTLHPSWPL